MVLNVTKTQNKNLHLGLVVALEIGEFFNDLRRFGNLDGGTRFVRDRNMIRRASIINRECWTVEILALREVVDEVQDHPRSLHERQAENCIH